MTARNYDTILTVANPAGFISGNSIIGVTSKTVAFIANVDATANQLKVKSWCLTRDYSSKCSQISRLMATPESIKEVNHIQEMHIAIGHLLCMEVERKYFSKN